jgi:phosphatidylglycerophosphate synthase
MTVKDTIVHEDHSTLSARLKPWWRFVGSLMPIWLAPNLITFAGGLFMIGSAALSQYTREDWALPWHAFCIFMFQTLDAVDGIQARKTKNSTKLGNYIDHFTDVFSLQIMFLAVFQTLQLDSLLFRYTNFFINYNIYLTHWETAVTNILYFPDGFSITEVQWIAMAIHMGAYFYPPLWSTTVLGYTLNNLFIAGLVSLNMFFFTLPIFQRVLKKQPLSILNSLGPLTGITIFLYCWMEDNPMSELNATLVLNLPYTFLTGELLASYLYYKRHPFSFPVYIYLSALWMSCSLTTLNYGFLGYVIFRYCFTMLNIAQGLDVPIFTLKEDIN